MRRPAPHEIIGPGGVLPVREDDLAAIDLAMLIEGETSGRPLDEILARFGRSRSTYYEKLRRFREEGLGGLIARPPGPRAPWRRPVEILRFIVSRKVRFPEKSANEIAEELKRLGHSISVRSVERTLSQFGLTRAAPRAAAARADGAQDGGPENGARQDAAPRDGTSNGDIADDGAAREGTPHDGTPDGGTAPGAARDGPTPQGGGGGGTE